MTSCLCLCRVSLKSPLISTSAHCSYKLTQREEWGQEVGSKGWGKGLNVDVIPTVRVWISVSFCLHWCSLPFAALAALVPRHARLVVLLVWATSWFNCWWCCWLEVQKKYFFLPLFYTIPEPETVHVLYFLHVFFFCESDEHTLPLDDRDSCFCREFRVSSTTTVTETRQA